VGHERPPRESGIRSPSTSPGGRSLSTRKTYGYLLREQWRLLAEGAPDDATAEYLHQYFEPTARAIDGLEKALAGLGLLDDALAIDLRKPQDYFHRVWATAFRADDLAATGRAEPGDADDPQEPR
jgi:hypothetical protein